jgi:hypothetical protein
MNFCFKLCGTADSESANDISRSLFHGAHFLNLRISSLQNFIVAIILLLSINISAQNTCGPPEDWTVNPAEFAFNGQITAKVFVHGLPVESGYLGALSGMTAGALLRQVSSH